MKLPERQPDAGSAPATSASRATLSLTELIRKAAPAALCITLVACQSNPFAPQVIQVPTPVRCAPNIGPEPDYPDTDAKLKAAPDLFTKVQELVAGRIMRIARDQVKSAALAGCAG